MRSLSAGGEGTRIAEVTLLEQPKQHALLRAPLTGCWLQQLAALSCKQLPACYVVVVLVVRLCMERREGSTQQANQFACGKQSCCHGKQCGDARPVFSTSDPSAAPQIVGHVVHRVEACA